MFTVAIKMGKKDKKSKIAEQKARVAAKQSKKAVQKEKKVKAKGGDDSDAEDVDLQYANLDLHTLICIATRLGRQLQEHCRNLTGLSLNAPQTLTMLTLII